MTTRFLVIAALMVVMALACALVPMLRAARREGRPRLPFVLALLLALSMPPAVLAMYLAVGSPQAMQPPAVQASIELTTAVRELEASLQRQPDDADGWALLARARMEMGQPTHAVAALEHVLQLRPDDADAMVAWAEAAAQADPKHLIGNPARARLQRAIAIDPGHQRALWLLGISDFQQRDFAAAAQHWRKLMTLLSPGSKVAVAVQQQLDQAEAQAAAAPSAPAPAPVALTVSVRIDPRLATKLQFGSALFVFARAVDGPPMPLAVARLDAAKLPTEVTLTDAMAMTPNLALSRYPKVRVAARISQSGDATPKPGDLRSPAVEVTTTSRVPITLTIDHVE